VRFKRQRPKRLIIVPQKGKKRKRRIVKGLKEDLRFAWGMLGKVAFVLLWIYSIWRIKGFTTFRDIINIIWATCMTVIVIAYIWAQIALRRRPPKDWQ